MNDYEEFKPESEQEARFLEYFNSECQYFSAQIRACKKEDRMSYVRKLAINDLILMNLYLQALKNEDYETCEVAKVVLIERGYLIPA